MAVYFLHSGFGFFFEFALGTAEIGAVVGNETTEAGAPRIEALQGVDKGGNVEAISYFTMNCSCYRASEEADPSLRSRAATLNVEMAAKIDASCFPWI